MNSTRNVELTPWYGQWLPLGEGEGVKPVLSYSKPHTFSTFIGEGKEKKNDRKVRGSHPKKKKGKKKDPCPNSLV